MNPRSVGRISALFLLVAILAGCGDETVTAPATPQPPGDFELLAPADAATDVAVLPTLDWEDSTDADTYTLEIGTSDGFTVPVFTATSLTSSAYPMLSELTQGATYYWRVVAVNSDGTTTATGSDFSFTVETLPQVPGAFTLLSPADTATGVSATPALDWEDSSGAQTYTLEIGDSDGFAAPLFVESNLTSSAFVMQAALTQGATYFWRVTAICPTGSAVATNADDSFTVAAAPATPGAFALLDPADSAVDVPVRPTFDWEDSGGADTYTLVIERPGPPAITETITGIVDSTYLYHDTLDAGVTYGWRVSAVNAGGGTEGTGSPFGFTTEAAAAKTITVTAPNGGESYVAGGEGLVEWTTTGPVLLVKIEFSANGGTGWTTLAESSANDGSALVTLPATPTANGLVRLSDATDAAVMDQSDASFITTEFTEISTPIEGVKDGAAAWGDYDNDGDLDIVVCGNDSSGTPATILYRNDAGTFVDAVAGLAGTSYAGLAWGDYDNDGDLDLVVCGSPTTLYRNDSGTLVDASAGLGAIKAAAWGDYDNDGDLDLAAPGTLYRNDAGVFVNAAALAAGGSFGGAVAWGDYDNDGDLDVVIAGCEMVGGRTTVFRNDAGTFVDAGAVLPEVDYLPAIEWGDYDADGDLDLALAGNSPSNIPICAIYRNTAGSFAKVDEDMVGLWYCDIAWGDIDNDGDLDLVASGKTSAGSQTLVYSYEDGAFVNLGLALPDLTDSALALGDYDDDGDLDFCLAGADGFTGPVAILYRNDCPVANTAPDEVTGLTSSVAGSDVTLGWDAASDSQTPPDGLNYNLRIGTTSGGDEVFSGMAASDGTRLLPTIGAVQPGASTNEWTIKGLAAGTYYWSVQAIDASYAGGVWAAEETLDVGPLADDAWGNNHSFANAADISAEPMPINGALLVDPEDYFIFVTSGENTALVVDCTHMAADVTIGLYDISEALLASDSGGSPLQINYAPGGGIPAATSLFIKVEDTGMPAAGPYALNVTEIP